jgi:hypothetical protein
VRGRTIDIGAISGLLRILRVYRIFDRRRERGGRKEEPVMTKRQALKAIVAGMIPWHLGWTRPPDTPGPYTIILDDVSEFVLAKDGEHISVPVREIWRALKS